MVTINKIYTRNGDKGTTSLGDGSSCQKSHQRIKALGEVDEIGAALGVASCYINNDEIIKEIRKIQNDLFDCGADLCVPVSDKKLEYKPIRISEDYTLYLEEKIDCWNRSLKPLNSFILAAGDKSASYIHFARTISRKAERSVVVLSEKEKVSKHILTFLNRLSDYLFVIARILNNNGSGDILWIPSSVGNNE